MIAAAKRPRLALIGISGYGRIHLQLARECRERGELDIVAAVVINPEAETDNIAELRAHGCDIFLGYEEMLERYQGAIDLCLIPTGIQWHARMTVAALRAGANVLVEKPLAGSLAEVAAVRQAEMENGRFVAVGFQAYYEPGTTWLGSELHHGTIGAIRSVRFMGIWPRQRSYYTRNDWAGRLQVDGVPVYDSPLNNAFAHFVMLSLLFAGPTPDTAAEATVEGVELFRAHHIESFDTGVVTLRTPQGIRLWFGASHACRQALEPEIVIHGSKGTAWWRYENEAVLRDAAGQLYRRAMPDTTATRRSMMSAVLRRLSDPDFPVCTTEMAGRHTAVIEVIHRRAPILDFPGDWVRWSDAGDSPAAVAEVRGLDTALRRAFAAQELLSDSGLLVEPSAGRG